MEFISLFFIFGPMLLAIFIYLVDKKTVNLLAFVLQGVLLAFALFSVSNIIKETSHEFVLGGHIKGIGIALHMDRLSIIFVMITILGIGYALSFDWKNHSDDHKYVFFVLILEGTLMAFFQARDLFTLFILLEMSTILSVVLIVYERKANAVRAGLYYLLINTLGMTVYLLGIVFIYHQVGFLDMDKVVVYIQNEGVNPLILAAVGCFLTAFCLKSALFPLGSWLPKAHSAAPAQISAFLSGLLVKLGIYGLIRISLIFGLSFFGDFLLCIGALTALVGVSMAMLQKDMKLILAHHTVSQMGLIIMGISVGTKEAYWGSVFHMVNHFLFKSVLFLSVGIIATKYKTRNIKKIKGVIKTSPLVAGSLLIGILGIMGFPFFNGSLSKVMIEKGFYGHKLFYWIAMINVGTIVSFIKFIPALIGPSSCEKSKSTDIFKLGTVVFMAALTAIAYPIELIIIGRLWKEEFLIKQMLVTGTLKFVVLSFIAVFVYKWILLPILKTEKHFGKLQMRFQEATTAVVCFLTAVWAYLFLWA